MQNHHIDSRISIPGDPQGAGATIATTTSTITTTNTTEPAKAPQNQQQMATTTTATSSQTTIIHNSNPTSHNRIAKSKQQLQAQSHHRPHKIKNSRDSG